MKIPSLHILLILLAVVLFSTCQKDYDLPTGNNKVVLNASTTDSVSYFTAKVQSRLANTANYTISDHGLCWGLEPNPKISDNKISNGYTAQPTDISASLKNLLPGKKYYIRSFATIPTGTVYGAQNEFTTLKTGIPVSVTDTITDITYTTALCKGIVVADSGLMVTKRGICWSLSPNPTLTAHFDTLGKGLGTYDIQIDALNPSSTYYIRAFAINDSGTSYGTQKSFITVALTPPTLTTTPVTNITTTTAESGGNITADGGSPITARGICWGILPNPTTTNNHTTNGTETGIFTSSLTALTPNTSYYVRAYATNALGTSYGDPLSFSTNLIVVPSLITADINNITINTAGSGGNITSDGGSSVTARGVCWSTTANPSITVSHTTDGSGTGSFTSIITGLTVGTTYHVRAYATNSAGTAYGSDLTFNTLSTPSITTTAISNITSNSASSGGNITSDGGSSVTARGVCWSTSANPSITASHTTDGSGTGPFTSSISGLSANTLYHVRAYAINSVGTAYGSDYSFSTIFNCGTPITVNHFAGSVAPVNKIVTYGTVTNIPGETTKCWITSNLGADHQATAVDDATEASAGWYWQFNRKQGYKLDGNTRTPATAWDATNDNLSATWEAAKDPCALELGSGWRLPTSTEWTNVDASGGWTTWTGPYSSGLKLHAAGYLNNSDGSLSYRGSGGNFWSSTQYEASTGWTLAFYSGYSYMGHNYKAYGYTARCLRD